MERRSHGYVSCWELLLIALMTMCCTGKEPVPAAHDPDPEDVEEAFRVLRALPYLNWSPTISTDDVPVGVTRHLPAATRDGLNFYHSRSRHEAWLIDMQGAALHRWASELDQPPLQIPETYPGSQWRANLYGWEFCRPLPNGDLLVGIKNHSLLRLSHDSRLLWRTALAVHHDVEVAETGDIYTLVYDLRTIQLARQPHVILDSSIVRLSSTGKVLQRISVYDLLREDDRLKGRLENNSTRYDTMLEIYQRKAEVRAAKIPSPAGNRLPTAEEIYYRIYEDVVRHRIEAADRYVISALEGTPVDPLHVNALAFLPQAMGEVARRGDLLISIRELDLLAIVDPVQEQVRWTWGDGELERQHDPSMRETGNILVFDNGVRTRRSRIVELDPLTREIVWTFEGDPPAEFYSIQMGACQGLANGNVLVTESQKGRAFELTRDHQVVWEFFNPDVVHVRGGQVRGRISRMMRFDREFFAAAPLGNTGS